MNERRFSLSFARALGEPRLSGTLRKSPEDFRVSEQLGFEPGGAGEHVWLYVRKTGANTDWVARQIARHASVRTVDVGYAGRKDRNAVAEQWFSCRLAGRLAPDWSKLPASGIEVLRSRRHSTKLRHGMHAGNRFELVVRDLLATGESGPAFGDLVRRIKALCADGFPNYFGEQRFGLNRNNLFHANELMQGNDVPRDKRGLYISAARSWLFNRSLSARVADGSWHRGDDFAWLPGISRVEVDTPVDAAFADWHAGLARLGVKAMRRALRVVPGNMRYAIEGDTVALTFELPAGSYATSLVRELTETTTKVDKTLGQVA
jgi:tRNA pseudouridine13 synthase